MKEIKGFTGPPRHLRAGERLYLMDNLRAACFWLRSGLVKTTMCERLADAHERVESLSGGTVLERLICALLKLAADFGETSAASTHIGHYIKQDELAKIVGPAGRSCPAS